MTLKSGSAYEGRAIKELGGSWFLTPSGMDLMGWLV